MDEETFMSFFGDERTWTTVLSDGTCVPLKPDGADEIVMHADRFEYSELVQQVRMSESDSQVCDHTDHCFGL
jgi:hypothetical protein